MLCRISSLVPSGACDLFTFSGASWPVQPSSPRLQHFPSSFRGSGRSLYYPKKTHASGGHVQKLSRIPGIPQNLCCAEPTTTQNICSGVEPAFLCLLCQPVYRVPYTLDGNVRRMFSSYGYLNGPYIPATVVRYWQDVARWYHRYHQRRSLSQLTVHPPQYIASLQ